MIRHYEGIGLLPAAERSESGYRQYGERELHALRFVRRGRDLGFSLDEIGQLLALWQDRSRPSREVKALASAHVSALDAKIAEMQAMRATLENLVQHCHGDDRPDCPILDSLGTAPASACQHGC
jgi:Cu(I)-responsive transcriptional regulator